MPCSLKRLNYPKFQFKAGVSLMTITVGQYYGLKINAKAASPPVPTGSAPEAQSLRLREVVLDVIQQIIRPVFDVLHFVPDAFPPVRVWFILGVTFGFSAGRD